MHRYVVLMQDWIPEDQALALLRRHGSKLLPIAARNVRDARTAAAVEALVTKEHGVAREDLEKWRKSFPRCEVISAGFTGVEGIDVDAAAELAFAVWYAPGYSTASVAELTVGLALSVLRRIPMGDEHVRDGRYDTGGAQPGEELAGKTVGVLGTGAIGEASIRRFRAFDCRVVAWSATGKCKPGLVEIGTEYVETLVESLRQADIVVLHLRAGKKGQPPVIGALELAEVRRGAVLVNTSRASLVDTNALISALQEGRLAGAGIDVFDTEPMTNRDYPLLACPGVVVTPHVGFKTNAALERLRETCLANVTRWEQRNDAHPNCLVRKSRPSQGY